MYLKQTNFFDSVIRESLYGNTDDLKKRSTYYRFHPYRDKVSKILFSRDKFSYRYLWVDSKGKEFQISKSLDVPIEGSDDWENILMLLQNINQEKHHGLYSEEELEDITDILIENGRVQDNATKWIGSY